MRIALFVTTVVFVILMFGGEALACDCVTASPEESFRRADVVFEGELIRAPRNPNGAPTAYMFRVYKMLKGPRVEEVTIYETGSNCDATFYGNTIYRVYAREHEGKLISGQCSGNEVLFKKTVIASYPPLATVSVWQRWHVQVVSIAAVALVLILAVYFITKKRMTTSRFGSVRKY